MNRKEFFSKVAVGDDVTLREDLQVGVDYGEDTYVGGMAKPGRTVKISGCFSGGGYFKVYGSVYNYTPEMVDHIGTKETPESRETTVLEILNTLTEDQYRDAMLFVDSKLTYGSVIKIASNLIYDQRYDTCVYRRVMLERGRTAKVVGLPGKSSNTLFKSYYLDKDGSEYEYNITMFDLGYIISRNPRIFVDFVDKFKDLHLIDTYVVMKSDLQNGKDYGGVTYREGMPEPGSTVKLTGKTAAGNYCTDSAWIISKEMFELPVPTYLTTDPAVGDIATFRTDIQDGERIAGSAVPYFKSGGKIRPGSIARIIKVNYAANGDVASFFVEGSNELYSPFMLRKIERPGTGISITGRGDTSQYKFEWKTSASEAATNVTYSGECDAVEYFSEKDIKEIAKNLDKAVESLTKISAVLKKMIR